MNKFVFSGPLSCIPDFYFQSMGKLYLCVLDHLKLNCHATFATSPVFLFWVNGFTIHLCTKTKETENLGIISEPSSLSHLTSELALYLLPSKCSLNLFPCLHPCRWDLNWSPHSLIYCSGVLSWLSASLLPYSLYPHTITNYISKAWICLKQCFERIKYKSVDSCLFLKWGILWKPIISNRKNGIKLVQILFPTLTMNLPMCGEAVKSSTYRRLTPDFLRHNSHGRAKDSWWFLSVRWFL